MPPLAPHDMSTSCISFGWDIMFIIHNDMGTFAKGPSISWSISQTKWHIPNHPLPSIPSIPWIRFWAYSPTFCLNQFEYGLLKPLLKRPFQFWSVAPFAQMCTFTSSHRGKLRNWPPSGRLTKNRLVSCSGSILISAYSMKVQEE